MFLVEDFRAERGAKACLAQARLPRKARLFASAGAMGLLAFAAPALAEPGYCMTSGDVSLIDCDTQNVDVRTSTGGTALTVEGLTLDGAGNINFTTATGATGPLTMELNVYDTIVDTATYGGVNVYSSVADTEIDVFLGGDVSLTATGSGFGGLWVRNEAGGDIDVISHAAVTASGAEMDGLTATTNAGGVTINNSGVVSSTTQRGIYADGGFGDDEAVTVSITNSGDVTALKDGVRSINYNGLSKIENSGTVESTTKRALVAWTPDGEVVIDNLNGASATSLAESAIMGMTDTGDITITNDGAANGVIGISAIAGSDEDFTGGGMVTVTNSSDGSIISTGGQGIRAWTAQGDVLITNAGTVNAAGSGIEAESVDGKVAIVNSGSITATEGIRTGDAATTITNSGTIDAGQGDAISMGGGDVTLVLQAGSNITGMVWDRDLENGTNSLVLGGEDDATFDASAIGTGSQFRDFTYFTKEGESTWTLTGNGTTGWTIEEGTLTATNGAAFGNEQAYVVNGGTLDIAGTTANISTLNGSEDGTVDVGGGQLSMTHGEDSAFAGSFIGTGAIIKDGTGTLALTGDSSSYEGNLDVIGGGVELSGTFTAEALTVGGSTSAYLEVNDRGTLDTYQATIESIGGTASVTVQGEDSTWVNNNAIQISRSEGGSGTLLVQNGGSVETVLGSLYLGDGGTVTVTGEGSALRIGTLHPDLPENWEVADGWLSADGGTVSILDGATLEADGSYIGGSGETLTEMTVDGEGTSWSNGLSLYIGGTGNDTTGKGKVTVSGGATVTAYTSALGVDAGSEGTLILTGEGTTYSVLARDIYAGNMRIGYEGTGTATVTDGAKLSAAALIDVGAVDGSIGRLTVSDGGLVQGNSMRIGDAAGSDGAVTVTGVGSKVEIGSGRIGVGVAGEGALTISNGGTVISEGAIVGWENGGVGTASVTGAGSLWTNSDVLYVGNAGAGTLNISSGGLVTSTAGYLGVGPDAPGILNIDGEGSAWTMTSAFVAGNDGGGNGTVNLTNGGRLSAVQGTLGNLGASYGKMLVSGAGSTWSAIDDQTSYAGYLNVGLSGRGDLTVTDGGAVEAVRLYIGNEEGSNGRVLLSGEGSSIITSQGLYVGANGDGALTLSDGASIEASVIKIGYLEGSAGTLNIGAAMGEDAAVAGSISTEEIVLGAGDSNLVFNHTQQHYTLSAAITGMGKMHFLAGNTELASNSSNFTGESFISGGNVLVTGTLGGDVSVAEGSALGMGANGQSGLLLGNVDNDGTLIFARSNAATYAGKISGNGRVTNVGAGTLTLSGNSSSFTGTTAIEMGKVLLTGALGGNVFIGVTGTLQVGDGANDGELLANATNNGTLIFNQIGDYDYSGALSGNGGLIKQGAGTLLLSGDYSYTGSTIVENGFVRLTSLLDDQTDLVVDGGTFDLGGLDQTVAGLSGGSGTLALGDGTLTVVQAENSVFGGSLTGTGSFVKSGAGSLNFTNQGSFTGSMVIDDGKVSVQQKLLAAVVVNEGGALGGVGTIGNLIVNLGGMLTPGNSIGTLNVASDVTFEKGSTYAVEVDAAGNSDKLIASGKATIKGGTVSVIAAAGNYRWTNDYLILSAAGGVSGKFDGADVDLPFLDPFLLYSARDVTLSLVRNDRTFHGDGTP